jgi:hypothetical protein
MSIQPVLVSPDRTPHWVRLNHQNRIPKRFVAFDTESKSARTGNEEVQTWAMGAAIRWRTDLKTGDHAEAQTFGNPRELWTWVSDYCKIGTRTVVWAHNLGHDIRISDALVILPALGFELEWCNLDRNVSSMTWRSDHGTLVFADTWTWLPMDLSHVGSEIGLPKLPMPPDNAAHYRWERYCMRDAEIVYRCVKDIIQYIKDENLGNWQPTGAGMAYATWRHKFMQHKVLVHDDVEALTAERAAMHTGRAEAWRHGKLMGDVWTEVDMRNAYTTIAAECDLPVKLKMKVGKLDGAQLASICTMYRVLARCRVDCEQPVAPYHDGSRTLWPVGTFETWLWDTEIAAVRESGGTISVDHAFLYTRAPVLADWAKWVLSVLRDESAGTSPVVRTWLKHCARALIGRIGLRCPNWDLFGDNPEGITGITHTTDITTGKTVRMMHVGSKTFAERDRTEGRDSLPQITSWIMAECRARLWRAMAAAGLSEIAHVDTDSLIVSRRGLAALRAALGADFGTWWSVKGSYRRMIVYGPRNYRGDGLRKAAGIPRKAVERLPNLFEGERWHGMAADLTDGRSGAVTVVTGTWEMTRKDPRRRDAPGAGSATMPYEVTASSDAASSSSPKFGVGA